jgi:hypothetical protein
LKTTLLLVSKTDKCGVCNGNGTTCKSHEGVVKESTLSSGYNTIIVLPVGATSIKIEENRPTSNSLGELYKTTFEKCFQIIPSF